MIRHKPLQPSRKPMRRKHRACGKPTLAQQAHQDAQRRDGCAMCHLLNVACPLAVRIHHRTIADLHGNKQLGQDCTVALCDWHHQGVLLIDLPTRDAMRAAYGPSLQHHKREFLDLIAEKLGERSTAALQRDQDARLPAREGFLE